MLWVIRWLINWKPGSGLLVRALTESNVFMPLTLLLMVTEFSALQRFRLEEESSPTPLPLTALFASAISDFCCAGKLKSPLLDTAVICSFCSSPADFARITLAPLESVNDVRFSASVSLLLISACGSASTVNDKFLPGKM